MQSSSRNGARVRVLAVHTTEGIMRATDLRAWKTWAGSSHASADETGVLLAGAKDGFVDYDRAAWTMLSGNPWSENIELCGFAKWKRADWLARPKLLDACARWLAERSAARGIPLVKLSPKEYRAGRSGVIGHVDHTVGYSDGTHWDPGPDFPYDVVLAAANRYRNGSPTPTPLDLGDDMRVLRTPDGTIWLATDTEVAPTSNLGLANSAAKAWGAPIPCTREEVQELINDAARRRGSLINDIHRAVLCRTPDDRSGAWLWDRVAGIDEKTGAPADVDEESLATALAASLNGHSVDEIAAALRGVLREGVGA